MTGFVAPNELLARYITSSRWFHKQDRTVKQDAFIPPNSELSVTRHLDLNKEAIWKIGKKIVEGTPRFLYGRADVEASHIISQCLNVVPQPVDGNPNHANIINWPPDKAARKMCALVIANAARFIANPEIEV